MTDYTNVPIAAAGDWIDDAYLNTYLGDNLRAIFGSLTPAGQLLVSLAANRLTKVAVTGNAGYLLTEDPAQPAKMKFAAPPVSLPAGGSAYQGLRIGSDGSTKQWAALMSILGRKGGSATDWDTPGTSNYTPTNVLIQTGAVNATRSNDNTGVAVTFPVAFSAIPIVIVSHTWVGVQGEWATYGVSSTGFTLVFCVASGTGGAYPAQWIAIGPK